MVAGSGRRARSRERLLPAGAAGHRGILPALATGSRAQGWNSLREVWSLVLLQGCQRAVELLAIEVEGRYTTMRP